MIPAPPQTNARPGPPVRPSPAAAEEEGSARIPGPLFDARDPLPAPSTTWMTTRICSLAPTGASRPRRRCPSPGSRDRRLPSRRLPVRARLGGCPDASDASTVTTAVVSPDARSAPTSATFGASSRSRASSRRRPTSGRRGPACPDPACLGGRQELAGDQHELLALSDSVGPDGAVSSVDVVHAANRVGNTATAFTGSGSPAALSSVGRLNAGVEVGHDVGGDEAVTTAP